MQTHFHGQLTFICSFILSFFTENFIENLHQLPFAIFQAVILGVISVMTKSCLEKVKTWYKARKEATNE